MTVTGSVVITDGYHDRIDMSNNGQLFIGSYTCTNVGNVNNRHGRSAGLPFDLQHHETAAVVIPPDNGDVTGLQSFTTAMWSMLPKAEPARLRHDSSIVCCSNNDYHLPKPEPSSSRADHQT